MTDKDFSNQAQTSIAKPTKAKKFYLLEFINIFWRGLCMGMADLVPGVSGGTMALLLGIYKRLLESLSGFSRLDFKLLLSKNFLAGVKSSFQKVDGFFILSLGFGILTAVFLFAGLLKWLLANYEVVLLAFFLGLMLATLLILLKEVKFKSVVGNVNFILGILFASSFSYLALSLNPENIFNFYIAGVLASCFMLLPGVSGSFLLLLLGIYAPVIDAIYALNFKILIVLALGIATGLIFFSRWLNKMLENFYHQTMAVLVGFIFGSMLNLWPWQILQSYSLIDGKFRVISKTLVSPATFKYLWGANYLASAIFFMILGFLLTFILHKLGSKNSSKK